MFINAGIYGKTTVMHNNQINSDRQKLRALVLRFCLLVMRGVRPIMRVKEGDYRDWDANLAWAKGMYL